MIFVLIKLYLLFHVVGGILSVQTSDLSSAFYDVSTKKPFQLLSIYNETDIENNNNETVRVNNVLKFKWNSKNNTNDRVRYPILRRLIFRSNGCACLGLTCSCCLGINITQFNFNREGCMNFTYDPYEFSVTGIMAMNGNIIFANTFSAKDPPALCLPVPIPYIPIQIETCARFYNIHTPGQNINMCFDFEGRIQRATLIVLHFDCLRFGVNGIALVKPDAEEISTSTEDQEDTDIYDEVTEIKYNM